MATLASKHAFHGDTSWQTLISSGDEIASLLKCGCDMQRMLMLVRDAALADGLNFAENSRDRKAPDCPTCCDLGNRGLGGRHKSRRWQVDVERTAFRGMKGWEIVRRLARTWADYSL